MRTREDAVRSARRYIASALGSPPWRVRMAMDGRFRRPAALVQLPNPAGWSPTQMVDTVRGTAALTIQLFPNIGATGSESKMLAERAADLLSDAILLGVADAHDPTVRGYREMIPLWDYTDEAGVPLPLEGPEAIATKRTPRDYLTVAPGWTFQTIPEAPDDQLFTAIGELRVQWFRNARLLSDGPVLTDVHVDPVPDVTITV